MIGSSRRAWLVVAASMVVILLAYVGDGIVAGAVEEARLNHSGLTWPMTLDAVARLLGVACMMGLAWLVFMEPRQRLTGAVMLVIGSYFAFGRVLSFLGSSIALPPSLFAYVGQTGLLLWTAAGVAVLGLVQVLRPSRMPNAP